MVDNPIPVKKSSTPDWYMAGEHAGDAGDPSEPIVIAKGPSDAALATEALQTAGNASLSSVDGKLDAQTSAAASASVDEDTTARGPIALLKGLKNLAIDAVGHLSLLTALISSYGLKVDVQHFAEVLSGLLDSIAITKIEKGAVTVAHDAITATATSAEVDCRGFNSLLVHWVSDQTDKTWTISVTGAMGSGLTFVPLLDKTTGLAASEITTDISGFFVISNIPDYVKIVATEVDDGANVTCKVQPFNS